VGGGGGYIKKKLKSMRHLWKMIHVKRGKTALLACLLLAHIRSPNCLLCGRSVLLTCSGTVSAVILRTPTVIGKDVLPPLQAFFLGDLEY
jgi:hypothetical protein